MTGPEYIAAIEQLGMNQSEAGLFFGAHPVTGRKWATAGPPEPVAMLLRTSIRLQWTADYLAKVSKERN